MVLPGTVHTKPTSDKELEQLFTLKPIYEYHRDERLKDIDEGSTQISHVTSAFPVSPVSSIEQG